MACNRGTGLTLWACVLLASLAGCVTEPLDLQPNSEVKPEPNPDVEASLTELGIFISTLRQRVEDTETRMARLERDIRAMREILENQSEMLAQLQGEIEEPNNTVAPPLPERRNTYRVQSGDTLLSIARKPEIYGDSSKWELILEANRDLIEDETKLEPGIVLFIPRESEEEKEEAQS